MLDYASRIFASIVRRVRHILILSRARVNSREVIRNREGNNILVICYGNIYRSPLAEHLLKIYCSSEKFSIESAGFHKKENRACDPEYLKVLKEYGYDLSEHRSKIIKNTDINWADIILIMDRYNWDMLKQMDGDCLKKVLWIGGLSTNKHIEVNDPYGKGYNFTKCVINDIESCTSDICKALMKC